MYFTCCRHKIPLPKQDRQPASSSTPDDTSWIEKLGVFKNSLKLPEKVDFPTS